MKRIKLVLSLFVGVLTFGLQAQNSGQVNLSDGPAITFEKTVHDWGTINEGDVVETDFVFTNTGKANLIIKSIKGSCGCTIPSDWDKNPIPPGTTSKFHVKFNSKGKLYSQKKKITIVSNAVKGNEYVTIKAQVTPDPTLEKIRADRIARSKKGYEDKKNRLTSPNDKVKRTSKQVDMLGGVTMSKDVKDSERDVIKADKKDLKVSKNKDFEKKNKRAEKAEKRSEKELRKTEKAKAKSEKAEIKNQKLQNKVSNATQKIKNAEFKLSKMENKLERLRLRGKLSPVKISKKEIAIQKQKNRINNHL
jgi:hypothetical protein